MWGTVTVWTYLAKSGHKWKYGELEFGMQKFTAPQCFPDIDLLKCLAYLQVTDKINNNWEVNTML